MARLWMAGAELGIAVSNAVPAITDWAQAPPDGAFSGTTPTIDTTTLRSGARAWKCRGVTAASYVILANLGTVTVAGRTYYAREHCLWTSTETPQVGTALMAILASGTQSQTYYVTVESVAGTTLSLALYTRENNDALASKIEDITGTYDANTWHRIEMSANVTSATQVIVNVLMNGASVLPSGPWTRSVSGASTTGPTQITFGKADNTTTASLWIDDLAVNDSTGAVQNSWPGDGKVVLLKPTGDSAIGTGWTLGTGTAIAGNSGKTAVANTPPLGVADLAAGSDPKQIRNATANANVNYDATMTTYTAAGIGASDVINTVDLFVATGAPLVTSAKLGTVGVVSNPAIANVSLSALGTAGAFWANLAAGVWPSGWKWSHGTMTYSPSVARGTAPVMRITQVTSSTRIADVCAMGIYVDYTPAAPAGKPRRPIASRQVPVMRAVLR